MTTLLQEHGWMPSKEECGTPLWREVSMGDNMSNNLVQIPPGSTLAIDGNGLAYHLHSAAYSRYFSQVMATPPSNGICTCPKHVTADQVVRCLPQSMPLETLHEITKEFVTSLTSKGLKLKIFWDGDGRRFKAETSKKRFNQQSSKWNTLHQYCLFGTLPFRHPCQRNFTREFPLSRLLQQQVISSLRAMEIVTMVFCDEEADRFVAQESADDPDCFCVGLDSDFCLFPRTKYIPLTTLNAAAGSTLVTGCLITRQLLSEQLQLPSDDFIVELALMVGNDYIAHTGSRLDDIVETLRDKDENYRVTSKDKQLQRAIDFSRALYNFGDLSDFPFDETPTEEALNDEEEAIDDDDRPVMPKELDFSLAIVSQLDFNLVAVIQRMIQAYIHSTLSLGMVSQSQFDVWHSSMSSKQSQKQILSSVPLSRPNWIDIRAAYVFERCIHYIFSKNEDSLAISLSSPMQLFDWLSFNLLIAAKDKAYHTIQRNGNPQAQQTLPVAMKELRIEEEKTPQKQKEQKRDKLPIDEHEADILDAVARNRVTIIHGETGCGKSSRVPVILLRAPPPGDTAEVKMFVSQPRRIAAKSLVERVRSVEPDLKHKIALRMGHGVREYEGHGTQLWFVTTGYLVRLLANHPEKFADHSHLIIGKLSVRLSVCFSMTVRSENVCRI